MWSNSEVIYVSCFDFIYQKLFSEDYSIHFEDLDDVCIYVHATFFNDDEDSEGEYTQISVFTNYLIEYLQKHNKNFIYNFMRTFCQ